jgi:hypothetical protein
MPHAGCRHCPYNHQNVSLEKRARCIQNPSVLCGSLKEGSEVDVLFWSGGKDSFLALRALLRKQTGANASAYGVVLITTFEVSL